MKKSDALPTWGNPLTVALPLECETQNHRGMVNLYHHDIEDGRIEKMIVRTIGGSVNARVRQVNERVCVVTICTKGRLPIYN